MANTSVSTTIRAGMQMDLSPYFLEKGQYNFLLNGTINDTSGNEIIVQNDGSNYLAVNYPDGFKVIGKDYIIELNSVIVFLVNPTTGVSQIGFVNNGRFVDSNDSASHGICNDCTGDINKESTPLEEVTQVAYGTYTAALTSDCLNFNINYPIDIEYRIVNNSLYIYFVDGYNNIRYIYFDIVDGVPQVQDAFKVIIGYDEDNCNAPIYSDEIDCNKLLYNPNFNVPTVDNLEDVFGGSLPAGTYQILIAYADVLGNPLTNYMAPTNPYPLRTRDITIETNYNTGKALAFDVENVDQSGIFLYYNIVIAQTVDNFTDFYLVATQPTTVKHFLFTGSNQVIKKLTPSDVFFQYGIYQTANSLTTANDYLFFANLKSYPRLNLQQAVSQIVAYWQTISIPEKELRTAQGSYLYRSALRDEVYPYAIVFEFSNNNDSICYPLVGPSKAGYSGIDDTIANNDVINYDSCGNYVVRNKRWQVYNTASILGSPHQASSKCDDGKVWEWGKFAYWESTETYPNDPEVWGDLCGQPIRHFKFPDSSVTHIHDGLNGSSPYGDVNDLFPIGIKIDHQSVKDAIAWAVTNEFITQEEADTIKSYRIVRGNRYGNKSIQAKGLLFDVWNYNKSGTTYYYPNFPYNDLGENILLAPTDETYEGGNDSDPTPSDFNKTGRYTFHSPDTHFTNTSLGSEIKLETDEYGKSEGYFNYCKGQPSYKILSTVSRSLAFAAGFAAATSKVTKECRGIMHSGLYTTIGVTAGTSSYIWDHPPIFTYNNFGISMPDFPAQVTTTDCKGTTFNWMNPLQIAQMAPDHVTGAIIMTAVLAVAGLLDVGLYFFADALYEIDLFTKLLQSLTPAKNYFIQYNSVGRYHSYKTIANGSGIKQRKLDYATYIGPDLVYVDELTGTISVNNRDRESSVFLKTQSGISLLPNPQVVDDSRVSMDSASITKLNERFNRNISSYYASIKNYVPSQYGTIYNINYLETGSGSFSLDDAQSTKTIFGGDTFINRFALKIKHSLFTQTRFNQLDNADVSYSELGNAAYPNYYLDYGEGILEKLSTFTIGDILSNPGNFFQDLVGTDDTRLDAKKEKFFYQQGYVHLYNYGIPYFIVESDVNVDFRHGENSTDRDYYPHQSNLDYWLQEENVPIQRDNTYIYNTTYSKQNHESPLQTIKPNTKFGEESIVDQSSLLVYTEQAKTLNEADNWKILRPESAHKLDSFYGPIVSVDGIESDKVLIRAVNGSQIFAAYNTMQTNGEEVQISTGGIFQSRPKEFAVTHLGYMGSQHRDILNTEFGHIFIDAKRGDVFNLQPNAEGLEELTRNGMNSWFSNNLPFYITKYYPELTLTDTDNSYNGLGISLCFDRRFDRFFLTKLDYIPKSSEVLYNKTEKRFYTEDDYVTLGDPKYFQNKSWTVSYNFKTKMWTSFHSFLPNYYIDYIDYFQSGLNNSASTLWSHNVSNKSYQVYYGQLQPFIIDVPTQFTGQNSNTNSLTYINDVIRYQNDYDYFYNHSITFNKAVIYNNSQSTGQLFLTPKSPDSLKEPISEIVKGGREIHVTNSGDAWSFNQFFDATKSKYNNIPIWNYDSANVNKVLNGDAFDYRKSDLNQPLIRGRMCSARLINDKYSNYKFNFILTLFNSTESIR